MRGVEELRLILRKRTVDRHTDITWDVTYRVLCPCKVYVMKLKVHMMNPEVDRHTDITREGGSWIRPQHAGSKPRGTRGAIPLSSSFKGGDPK